MDNRRKSMVEKQNAGERKKTEYGEGGEGCSLPIAHNAKIENNNNNNNVNLANTLVA